MALRVVLAGATGETGRRVLDQLLQDKRVEKVTTLGRRESTIQNEKLVHKIVNFDNLRGTEEAFKDHDVAICTLGTTRGKSGKEGFLKVDRDYVLEFAELSKEAGVTQFHMMSSQGANANAWFLYTQVKGQVDEKLAEMGFETAVIYRPAVLLLERNERRLGEKIAIKALGALDWNRGMSVPIEDVAVAMASNIHNTTPGNSIVDNSGIIAMAGEARKTLN